LAFIPTYKFHLIRINKKTSGGKRNFTVSRTLDISELNSPKPQYGIYHLPRDDSDGQYNFWNNLNYDTA